VRNLQFPTSLFPAVNIFLGALFSNIRDYVLPYYIRMDLGEVGWSDVDWIGLAQGRNR
jgi:hypothetical protein